MKKRTRLFNLLVITILLLSACNLPSGQTNDPAGTAAAQTVQALLSATPPRANTSTSTPGLPAPASQTPVPPTVPTNTPVATATTYCNIMQFVTDVTIPDGTVEAPGAVFTKTWRLKNVGTCAWTPSYAIVFSDGNSMNGPSTQALVGNVNPGQTIDISVNLTAPATPSDYTGNWKIRDASGVLFGKFYVQIKVQGPATPTFTALPLTATYTLPPPAIFAVTGVTYTASTFTEGQYVNCPSITANITASGAGDITYHWINAPGSAGSTATLHFNSAGTKASDPNKWYVGPAAPGPLWVSIYIDTPNHQEFSHFTVSACTGYP
jgi:hypothetical protein